MPKRRPLPEWVLDIVGGLPKTGGVVVLGTLDVGPDTTIWPAILEALGTHWPDVAGPSFLLVEPPHLAFTLDGGREEDGVRLAERVCDALGARDTDARFGVGATGHGAPTPEHAARRALRALEVAPRKRAAGTPRVFAWSRTRPKPT